MLLGLCKYIIPKVDPLSRTKISVKKTDYAANFMPPLAHAFDGLVSIELGYLSSLLYSMYTHMPHALCQGF